MSCHLKKLIGILGVAIFLGWAAPGSQGQVFQVAQAQANQQLANAAAINAGARAGFHNNALANPYFGYGYYGYNPGIYGGALSGLGDVISAQGQFMVNREQSWILTEQARQEKIRTRRMTFDEKMYEQANTPSVEDLREQARVTSLRRSLNNPPDYEIWSGEALNTILENAQKDVSAASLRPVVPLSPEILERINLSGGTTNGSLGLFRESGKMGWPLILKGSDFSATRQKIDDLAQKAMAQAGKGAIEPETLQEFNGAVDSLRNQLREKIDEVPMGDYLTGKRFIAELEGASRALQDPNVNRMANRSWAAQGRNVGELVDFMTRQGLRFAKAISGDEAAYLSLHRSMVNYTLGLTQLHAQKPPEPKKQ